MPFVTLLKPWIREGRGGVNEKKKELMTRISVATENCCISIVPETDIRTQSLD